MFRFKQFSVDQSACAMKINTDGVLLGAIAEADKPASILDIGTGTGVIALMLAQRYKDAKIDAVEIDAIAAETAGRNFANSPFTGRLTVYPVGFQEHFDQFSSKKYDLIISNPPFYIGSLKSPAANKSLAKHTNIDFFIRLIWCISKQLILGGKCWLIVPVNIAETVIPLAADKGLFPTKIIQIKSYQESHAHRVILCLASHKKTTEIISLTIYKAEKIYSDEYQNSLKPYFIVF